MTNFRVASVDGYGEKDDIALANDRAEGQKLENQTQEMVARHQAILASLEYGTSEDAKNISQIVKEMIESEVGSKSLNKSDVVWDVETISDAVTEACIILGLDDEQYSPWTTSRGFTLEISLF